MKNLLMIIFCVGILTGRGIAVNVTEEQIDMFRISSLQKNLPAAAEKYLRGAEPENTEDFFGQAWSMIKNTYRDQKENWKNAARSAAKILFIVVICGLFSLFPGEYTEKAVETAGLIGISAISLSDVSSLIGLGKETLQDVSDYSLALIPVLTAAASASGNITASAATASGTVVFLRILIWAFQRILTPLIYAVMAFSFAGGISGQAVFDRFGKVLSGVLKNGLKILMFLFSAWLSITGIISGNVDAMALKAAKITSSTVVPVVGGMISDAAETVLVSASLLKNSIGIFGMLAVLAIILVPFLKIGMNYVVLQITDILASTVGMKAHTDYIRSVCAGMGNLMGVITCCSLMLFLSCVCVMKVTVLT